MTHPENPQGSNTLTLVFEERAFDTSTASVDQVAKMDCVTYFARLAALMESNPPSKDDAAFVARLAKIGCVQRVD